VEPRKWAPQDVVHHWGGDQRMQAVGMGEKARSRGQQPLKTMGARLHAEAMGSRTPGAPGSDKVRVWLCGRACLGRGSGGRVFGEKKSPRPSPPKKPPKTGRAPGFRPVSPLNRVATDRERHRGSGRRRLGW